MSVLKLKDELGVWQDIPSIVGEAAGFGTVTATVDTNVGTPTVVVTSSGEDTAKNFAFQFKNLGYDDSDLQSDFSDLANDFDVLQGQFDTAVAAVTTDTEVTDIRVGADGVTDTTAGASVRRQFSDVKSALTQLEDGETPHSVIANKYINENNGAFSTYNGWAIIDYIDVSKYDVIYIKTSTESKYNAFYDSGKTFISSFRTIAGESAVTIPTNAVYMALSNTSSAIAGTTISTITASEVNNNSFRIEANAMQDRFAGVRNYIANTLINPYGGIIFEQSEGLIKCSGKAVANAYHNFYYNSSALPSYATAGKTLKVYYSATAVKLDVLYVYSGSGGDLTYPLIDGATSYFGEITIPTNAKGLIIRLAIPNGTTIDESDFLCVYDDMTNAELTASVGELSNKLPSYYYVGDWWQTKLDDIRTASAIINGQTFAFITDTHFNANSKNSKYLLKDIVDETTIPFVLCGGDVVGLYGSADALVADSYETVEYQNYIGKDKFFSTRGNHDFYNSDNASSEKRWLTEAQAYDILGRNCERFTIDMLPAHLCYVIENASQNTVILMINSKDADRAIQSRITGAQAKWICDELLKYKDWNIVAVSHIPADPNIQWSESTQLIVHTILSAFNNRGIVSTTHNGVALSADFSTATGYVWCHINGHTHEDNSSFADNVLSIVTTCDAYYHDDGYNAQVGTVTEQAFDVFCIDYDAETITAVRIGRGYDRVWTKSGSTWTQTT